MMKIASNSLMIRLNTNFIHHNNICTQLKISLVYSDGKDIINLVSWYNCVPIVSQDISVSKLVLTPGEHIKIVYPIHEGSWDLSSCVSTSTVTSSYSAAITQMKGLYTIPLCTTTACSHIFQALIRCSSH